MNKEFKPKKSLSKRYAESITDEDRKIVKQRIKMKEELIQKYLDKGMAREQAETTAMRVMYIPGFAGPTFKD
jgi:hypothetical protein